MIQYNIYIYGTVQVYIYILLIGDFFWSTKRDHEDAHPNSTRFVFQTPSLSQNLSADRSELTRCFCWQPILKNPWFLVLNKFLIMFLKVMVRSSRNPSESGDHFFWYFQKILHLWIICFVRLGPPSCCQSSSKAGPGEGVQCQSVETMRLSHDGQRIQKMMKITYN